MKLVTIVFTVLAAVAVVVSGLYAAGDDATMTAYCMGLAIINYITAVRLEQK